MKHRNLLLFSILALLITGCTQLEVLPSPTETQVLVLLSATATPTQPPPTALPPATNTPLPSITSTPDIHFREQCIDIRISQPQEISLSGTLVLKDEWFGLNVYLLNLETADQTPQQLENIMALSSLSVSPDKKRLAVMQYDDQQHRHSLTTFSANGKIQNTISLFPDLSSILGWQNDELLAIGRVRSDGLRKLDSTIIVSSISGEIQELLPDDYNSIYKSIDNNVIWLGYSFNRTVYNPASTYVVYSGLENGKTPLFLANVQTKSIIARINWWGGVYGATPQWFRNGQSVLVTGQVKLNGFASAQDGIELFRMDLNGQVTRLTYLSDVYTAYIRNFTLSPDEQRVAFWMEIQDPTYPGVRLGVLDLQSGEMVDYCISGAAALDNKDFIPPVWSPDSKQISVTQAMNDGATRKTIIIDLISGKAFELLDQLIPLGWMSNK